MTGLPAIHFSPEHEDLRAWAREFANREIAPLAEKIDRSDEYPFELAKKMGEYGLLGIGTPKEYGGLGLDLISAVVVAEEIAKVSLSAGLIIGVQNGLVAYPISQFGSEEQKQKFLPRLAKGEIIGSYGLTEPGAGSDAANIQTKAEKSSDGSYKINGSKIRISQGLHADVVVLFTRTGSVADGAAGMTAFLVEKGNPGFSVGGKLEVIGIRGTGTAELLFKDCAVPESRDAWLARGRVPHRHGGPEPRAHRRGCRSNRHRSRGTGSLDFLLQEEDALRQAAGQVRIHTISDSGHGHED